MMAAAPGAYGGNAISLATNDALRCLFPGCPNQGQHICKYRIAITAGCGYPPEKGCGRRFCPQHAFVPCHRKISPTGGMDTTDTSICIECGDTYTDELIEGTKALPKKQIKCMLCCVIFMICVMVLPMALIRLSMGDDY